MVIDTSAVIAMLAAEPEAGAMASMISLAVGRQMSAATYLESAIVVEARYGVPGGQKLDQLIEAAEVRIEPVTVEQATVARIAFANMVRAILRPLQTSETALPTLSRKYPVNRCSLLGLISLRPTSPQQSLHSVCKLEISFSDSTFLGKFNRYRNRVSLRFVH